MPGDAQADEAWRQYLTTAAFLSGQQEAAVEHPARRTYAVVLAIAPEFRQLITSRQGLRLDGYTLDEPPPQEGPVPLLGRAVKLTYQVGPLDQGIWEAGADFHWGFPNLLLGTHRVNLGRLDIGGDWDDGREAAFEHFKLARAAFAQGRFAHAARLLADGAQQHGGTIGYRKGWRAHFLRAVLQMGFIGGDLELVDLAAAEDAFVEAVRYAELEDKAVASQIFVAASFVARQRNHWGPAQTYARRALELLPGFPEALYQSARIHLAMNDTDNAYAPFAKAVGRDRGYLLRAAACEEFQKRPELFAEYVQDLQNEIWERGKPYIDDARRQVALWRTRNAEVNQDEGVRILDAYGSEGKKWRIYDLIRVLAEREHMVEKALEGARRDRTATIKAVEGPAFEDVETYTVVEETEPPIIVRPGGWKIRDPDFKPEKRQIKKTRQIERHREAFRVQINDGAGRPIAAFDLVAVEPGKFVMGADEIEPGHDVDEVQHTVELGYRFYLSLVPVPQAVWTAVMGRNPSAFQAPGLPVEQVEWFGAVAFCNNLSKLAGLPEAYTIDAGQVGWGGLETRGFRLPTEAEWEYACRAGKQSAYTFGDELTEKLANFDSRHGAHTTPVNQFPPNAWGLRDLHGNVWEWCWDLYGDYPSSDVTDPVGVATGDGRRVIRGGCWGSEAESCRAATRNKSHPRHRHNSVGFRIALSRP